MDDEHTHEPILLDVDELVAALPWWGPRDAVPDGGRPAQAYSAVAVRRWVREGRLKPYVSEAGVTAPGRGRGRLVFERGEVERFLSTWEPWRAVDDENGLSTSYYVEAFRRNIGVKSSS